ncbi:MULTISPECIES: hypothetical protein [unclassified Flavobacterium]|nr:MULTISPECIES: hypothetical protein [unclassified Flavobacterium]
MKKSHPLHAKNQKPSKSFDLEGFDFWGSCGTVCESFHLGFE